MGATSATVTAALDRIAAAAPDRIALADRTGEVTYAELARLSDRMAGWLDGQGLAPGEMVGVTIREPRRHLLLSLALMRLGCDQVALASHDPPAQRSELACRAGVELVIGDSAADALPGCDCLSLDEAAARRHAGLGLLWPQGAAPGGTTVLLTSSGTTGRPKLIPATERLILAWALKRPDFAGRVCVPLSLELPLARRRALMTLSAGDTWVALDARETGALVAAIRHHRINHVTFSPSRAEALLQEADRLGLPAGCLAGTRLLVVGAPVPAALRARLQARLTRHVYVGYGTTECGGLGTLAGPDDHARHARTVGRAFGVELAIVGPDGARLPPGQAGRVRLRSEHLVAGYLDDPEATARAFLPDGWYDTGDIGSLAADGSLLFEGRADDMMLLGSLNIFPAEIEHVAQGFPGLADCAAFAVPVASLGDVPMLAVVETAPGALDTAALLAACRARLGLRAPRRVLLVPALPRNAAGKVLRRELAATADPRSSGRNAS